MRKPIVKLNLRKDVPPIVLELTPLQNAVVTLALSNLLAAVDGKNYEHLQEETINAFGELRTTVFGIQAQIRYHEADHKATFTT